MSAASASSACVIFFSIIAVLMSESTADCLLLLRMNAHSLPRPELERSGIGANCNPSNSGGVHFERHSPDGLARLKKLHCRGPLWQRETGADERPHLALSGEGEHGIKLGSAQRRILTPGLARAHAEHRAALEQDAIGSVGGNAATGKADDQQLAAMGETAQHRCLFDTDWIEHDVDTSAGCE